jgi:hypothetical protein
MNILYFLNIYVFYRCLFVVVTWHVMAKGLANLISYLLNLLESRLQRYLQTLRVGKVVKAKLIYFLKLEWHYFLLLSLMVWLHCYLIIFSCQKMTKVITEGRKNKGRVDVNKHYEGGHANSNNWTLLHWNLVSWQT